MSITVAVLGESKAGFIQPMSLGLVKMLSNVGAKAQYFEQGLALLDHTAEQVLPTMVKNGLKRMVNLLRVGRYPLQPRVNAEQVKAFHQQLQAFDVIVVVCHIPSAFIAARLSGIERLRIALDIPIVLYQNYYLATRGPWYDKIVRRKQYGEGFGLERYDWYLAASMVSEYPLSDDNHPCSVIGHDLSDDSLAVDANKPFRVLLDFVREGFEDYRQLQIQALNETNTPYTQLQGRYSQSEIRALYRQHSALFLSFRESFGLPIVENQLCGNLIFSPYKAWTPSHYLNKPLHQAGEGQLGDNFQIYDNDLETLKCQLQRCKRQYQPQQVRERFEQQYPQLYQGDQQALKCFVEQISQGQINAHSHLSYLPLNETIASTID